MNPLPEIILAQAVPTGAPANPIVNFVPILLTVAIFYFLLIRPMQKQRKQQQKMIAELQNGAVVQTNGGIIGTVVALTDDTVTLRVKPDNVKLTFARSSVSGLVTEESK